ncbi:uncharacterized protein YWHAH-AS1 isoform X2 [Manis javanica]|uniref:uncharacterized protein YWHAH-AS1 isoform X2 n=1 Tax=Manis javanica TaxID=9974 RepID=UPI003C6D5CAE
MSLGLASLPAPLGRPSAPRSPRRPRTRTGSPAGPRLQAAGCRQRRRSRPLAGSPRALWLAPPTPRREERRPRRGMGGWQDACAVGAVGSGGGEWREWWGKGGPALTVYFKVTSPTINSCRHRPAPELRRRPVSAAVYRRRGGASANYSSSSRTGFPKQGQNPPPEPSGSEGPGHFTTGSSANNGSVTQEDETGMLQRSSVWIMLIRGAEEGNADLLHSRPWGSSLAVRFHSLKGCQRKYRRPS